MSTNTVRISQLTLATPSPADVVPGSLANGLVSRKFTLASIVGLTHTHTTAQISGLQAALDGKAAVASTNVSRVVSLNGITGAAAIVAGDNVTISTAGTAITISAAGGGTGVSGVSSVNGKTGAITLLASDVSAASASHSHVAANITDFAIEAAKGGPVSSVNGATGTVTITVASLSAASSVHTHTSASITDFATAVRSAQSVSSVNGATGTVTISVASLSAASSVHATNHMAGGSDLVLPIVTTVTLTSSGQVLSLPSAADIFRLSFSSGTASIAGLSSGQSGMVKMFCNVGTNTITLKHQDTNATASARLVIAGNADLALAENDCAPCWYDTTSSRWRVV